MRDDRPWFTPYHDYLESFVRQIREIAAPAENIFRQVQEIGRLPQIPETMLYRSMVEFQENSAAEAQKRTEFIDRITADARSQTEFIKNLGADVRRQSDFIKSLGADARTYTETTSAALAALVGEYGVLKDAVRDDRYQRDLAPHFRSQLAAIRPTGFPAIAAIQEQLWKASASAASLYEFQQTFTGRVLGAARAVASAPESERDVLVEEAIEVLTEPLDKSRGNAARKELLHFAFDFLMFLATLKVSRDSEERIMTELRSLRVEFGEVAAKVASQPGDLRVVMASRLKVHSAPTRSSEVVACIWRNSPARVLAEQGEWAQVEFLDYQNGATRKGWVSRRFLGNLPHHSTDAER